MVCESIWEQIAGPVLLWPLVSNIPSPPSLVRVPKGLPCVRPLCSLYTMERFFHTVTNTRFINALAGALLLGSHPVVRLLAYLSQSQAARARLCCALAAR